VTNDSHFSDDGLPPRSPPAIDVSAASFANVSGEDAPSGIEQEPSDSRTADSTDADSSPETTNVAEVLAAAEVVADVICWRCGKSTRSNNLCRWCRAPNDVEPEAISALLPADSTKPILRLMKSYAVLLICAAIFGVVAYVLSDQGTGRTHHHSLYSFSVGEAVLEAFWTAVVLMAILTSPRPPPLDTFGKNARCLGWALALPTLGLCLLTNLVYHHMLFQYVGNAGFNIDVSPSSPPSVGEIVFAIVTVCVQPGIIEELFFRYLALGTLRTVMSRQAAVIVSSVMFGVAHIHTPLSIPVLIIVGLGLGFVRLLSGSLILPMLMHALHNGFVLWGELAT